MSAVVFVDLACAQLRERLQEIVGQVYDTVDLIDVSGCDSSAFITAWHERYGGAVQPSPKRQSELDDVPHCLVCYVTESKTVAHADVAYAVFVAEIPTLTVTPSEPLSPLLHSAVGDTIEAQVESLQRFFAGPSSSNAPEVIVMEGGDGAGKQTQTALLVQRIKEANREVHTLDFPHDSSLYGGLVRVVLSGKKGSISELDPQLFSFLYSLNRFGCARLMRFWLRRGSAVVLDRYYTANFGHQASKLPPAQREAFIEELEFTEVNWLKLPKATAVLYLDLPPAAALEAMRRDTTRKQLDIHETAGGDYKEKVRQTYRWCCDRLPGWHRVVCFDKSGCRLTREEVHASVVTYLRSVHSQAVRD
ncbi:thymidylate kinase-like protein [Leptomonas pyrrhocoris]|uniref:Thymidylate kinase-like protein n=1 Tax=Leptomonas pyrrhocoris TaxID=157538 RepID=A0A0M9FU20_LEPPY|nr:thymidylate kinase-like protein [Leptomonas pyrrhocoris]KPA75856.1 thymidylate kinase-like protein [Leptomonas pyrrhocoris]|eukprot:XP_015654295.1 thymidylate kinase-like protein [Leptomonas pyrrhocoris]